MQTSLKILLPNRDAELNRKPKESETMKVWIVGLVQGCISFALLKIKTSSKNDIKDCM